VWGHSELLKLAIAGPTAAPVERLQVVRDYFTVERPPAVAHWRTAIP
jgi:hypothetical protein